MLAVFYTSRKLVALDALLKRQKDNQHYFAQMVIPELQSERSRFANQKTLVGFAAQMDNSMCLNDTKMTSAFDKVNVIRAHTRSIH
jgi:hypothetical protein